jgi:crotonobetainyl-CoA:carnitine CoA-transferase CaiB-like acyl-CoA transferase
MQRTGTTLDGIRVLDLGRYQAGPRCGLMLARLGAETIKVESLRGDESRANGPIVKGQSAYWVQYNSGKKSLAIDLRAEKGKAVLRDLVKVSDIFIQNFRPGTIDKMGFGYAVLRALNPGIVMVNVSAYGQTGPNRDGVGFDPIGQAMSGLMWLTGRPGDPPVKTHFPLVDRITALHATIGALAALRERELSGEGQSIDVSLADSGFTTNEIPISAYLADGTVEQRDGNGRGLSNVYETADGWAFIHATSDAIWPRACEAMGQPGWRDDPRLASRAGREEHAAELETILAAWFAARTTDEAVERLSAYSIPAAPVNTVEQAATSPQLHQREVMVEVPDAAAGSIYVSGKVIKFSRTPMVVGPAPTVGQHTSEVLGEILGYASERVRALADEGIVAVPAADDPTEGAASEG